MGKLDYDKKKGVNMTKEMKEIENAIYNTEAEQSGLVREGIDLKKKGRDREAQAKFDTAHAVRKAIKQVRGK